jgi:plasmid stabilization system protein ParE
VSYRVRVLGRAASDLAEIRDYLDREAPLEADRVVGGLIETIESLRVFPLRGALPRDDRLRRLGYRFIQRAPYLVFYKMRGRTVRVHRVLHGKRAWALLL